MSVYVSSFVVLTAFCVGPLLALANSAPRPGEIALVVTWPGTDPTALIEDSGGRIVGPTTAFMGTLAVAEDSVFLSQLRSNGALLVRDGTLIARLCGVAT